MEIRLSALGRVMKMITNDDARYALGEKMRELGYVNASDFLSANPPEDHVREVERFVMPQ